MPGDTFVSYPLKTFVSYPLHLPLPTDFIA